MADPKVIQKQLKALNFGRNRWNQAEIRELPRIIHDDETISECVNGIYEGGVALLVATELRVLLIDKKPLQYLNVEDLRFDMINEIDFSHRLTNATITISTGSKTLKFKSYNQPRLRNLINLVQEHMSNGKKEQSEKAQSQQQHLEEINKQLQMYLMAQHQQLQMQMQQNSQVKPAEMPKPDPKLSDYLFAQRLLEQFQKETGRSLELEQIPLQQEVPAITANPVTAVTAVTTNSEDIDLASEARKEVFGSQTLPGVERNNQDNPAHFFTGMEINPIKVAYSKLPMMLRNRKFGRPSLRAHSQQPPLPGTQPASPTY